MHRVLGIVASARPWGNSEVAIREALASAEEAGAEVSALRISDFRIEPCTGCMRCVLRGQKCPIEDDLDSLLEAILQADGLLLAAPTYFLNVPGPLKSLFDRLLVLSSRWEELGDEPPRKPGGTICISGLRGWRGVTRPFLNAFLYCLGFVPVGSLAFFAPGPGELLLDDDAMRDVRELGRRVALGELAPARYGENACPVCGADFFYIGDGGAECPVCGSVARVTEEDGRLRLDFAEGSSKRWTYQGLREHVNHWIKQTGVRFLEHRHQIKERRKRLEETSIRWIRP